VAEEDYAIGTNENLKSEVRSLSRSSRWASRNAPAADEIDFKLQTSNFSSHSPVSRREFLSAALLLPALAQLPGPAGTLVGTVPFGTPGLETAPLNRLLGAGLDARQFTDLSHLSDDRLVTPSEHFFVRTQAPAVLPDPASWSIALDGRVENPSTIDLGGLERLGSVSGRYLIECAGNADPNNYGLMSVADWSGVPLSAVLGRMRPAADAARVLVSGKDVENTATQTSRTSLPGASWIFSRDDLSRAMLALRMNGAPLTRDHGAPVRLVVPGWYGCACIKWVDRIELVPDAAPPTTQMWEFANRTHQVGPPALAKDYTPAVIDTAAVPVRVEQWNVGGRTEYRVVGIIWGGRTPTNALAIRFRTSEPWVPVENCPLPAGTLTWSLWTHTWRPTEPGRYEIVLKVTDPAIRTRRLDLFYYVREMVIEKV
jgi:DMSO/TMAO reductase YedYZ molybdopterin-dependent catalytic subunit